VDDSAIRRRRHSTGPESLSDIVATHTAWDSVMMAHPDFYKQGHGKSLRPAGLNDVAGLNYANPELLRIHE